MSELKARITEDMKSAMKAKDKQALKAVRMIIGAIKQKEIDDRIELDDAQVMAVIQKMVKQRKDSISQFKDAGRTDLVDVEEAELVIINNYMPEQLSEAEVVAAVDKAIADSGASSMQDMGKLMGLLKGQLDGKA
ncbi:MAG: GatB/YqeY domain-containing protein, partial [Candidatus Thioglobus sp.]|nr:GatB/YqeY domain-containing protein [Candidatus Thioglobus sp.]